MIHSHLQLREPYTVGKGTSKSRGDAGRGGVEKACNTWSLVCSGGGEALCGCVRGGGVGMMACSEQPSGKAQVPELYVGYWPLSFHRTAALLGQGKDRYPYLSLEGFPTKS